MNFFEFAESMESYPAEKWLDDIQIEVENNQFEKQLQLQQWNMGEDSNGDILGRYSKTTEELSDGRKKWGETYDINETGQTRRNLQLYGDQSNNDILFYFDSKSAALPGLMERIGDRLFGLQDKNIGQFTDIAQNIAVDLLNTNLNLK